MTAYHRILLAGLLSVASRSETLLTPDQEQVDPVRHRSFADELTSILYTNDNECSSVLGVSMAFSLIYPGCTGDAIDEMQEHLGYPAVSNSQMMWGGTTKRLLAGARGQCEGRERDGACDSEAPLLKIANSIWFDSRASLSPDYAFVVGSYAKQIDFEADVSPGIINEWVNNATNGLIDSIIPEDNPLKPPWELIAINSIYLKAAWKHPFRESKTNLDSFYGSASRNTEVAKAHFMHGVFNDLPYSHEALPGYQVIRLPFASSQMSMILVLPMSATVGAVVSGELLPALNSLQPTRVALSVPKFKFDATYDDSLKAAMRQAGIVAPFSGGSLCGLLEDKDGCESLFVDKVVQKIVIDVHEIGVEAAAVTAILTGRSAPNRPLEEPTSIMCDHPFQFFIYDKTEDLVIFEGRLGAPGIPKTKPAVPLLDSSHSESDFWSKAFFVEPVTVNPATDRPEPKPTHASSGSLNNFIKTTSLIGVLFAHFVWLILSIA